MVVHEDAAFDNKIEPSTAATPFSIAQTHVSADDQLHGFPEVRFYTDRDLLCRLAQVAVLAFPADIAMRCAPLVTSALVGHLNDTSALAALGLCNVFAMYTGYSQLSGLAAALSTLSSQAWGAECFSSVGAQLQRGFLILLCFADLPLIVVWLSAEKFLIAVGQPPDVARWVGLYTKIRVPGILFETVRVVVEKTLQSIGNQTIPSVVSMCGTFASVLLSFILIPKFGFIGAPIVATVTDVMQATLICICAWHHADFRKCWIGFSWDAWRDWGAFLKLACPALVLQNVDVLSWDIQTFLAGFISKAAQATQAFTPSLADLQFSMGQSMYIATSNLVGNLLGEGQPLDARRVTKVSMSLHCVCMLAQACVFFAFMDDLPYVFTKDSHLVRSSRRLLPLCLVFSFFDGYQMPMCAILTGAGKQIIMTPLVLVSYWLVGVPLGIMLAFGAFGLPAQGLHGLWIGMLVGVLIQNLVYAIAVWRIDWQQTAEDVRRRMDAEDDLGNP